MFNIQNGPLLPAITLYACLVCASPMPAAETNKSKLESGGKKDSQTLVLEMRLKSLTKQLDLTNEQQQKVQVLLEDESKRVAKLSEDKSLDIPSREEKRREIQAEIYSNIKSLLSEAQLAKWTLKSMKKSVSVTPSPS